MVVCPDSRGLSLRGDALLASLRSTGGEARADPAGQGCGVALPTDFEALTEAMEADVNPHRVSARACVYVRAVLHLVSARVWGAVILASDCIEKKTHQKHF
jgi:hypothetical protein